MDRNGEIHGEQEGGCGYKGCRLGNKCGGTKKTEFSSRDLLLDDNTTSLELTKIAKTINPEDLGPKAQYLRLIPLLDHPNLESSHLDTLLALNLGYQIDFNIVTHDKASQKALSELSKNSNVQIRRLAAMHENIHVKDLWHLSKDPVDSIAKQAMKNPNYKAPATVILDLFEQALEE